MAIFNSYVKLPEGKDPSSISIRKIYREFAMENYRL